MPPIGDIQVVERIMEPAEGSGNGNGTSSSSSSGSNSSGGWTVGCLLSKKKQKSLCFPVMQEEAAAVGITLRAIDETQPLHQQGPFHAIVHKMTDIILAAENGDAFKQAQITDLLAWEQSNTRSFLIDPLEKVKKLLHRGSVCDIVRQCHVHDTGGRSAAGPPFVVLNADTVDKAGVLAAAGVQYPVLVKPMVAHGSREAHTIRIVFNDAGLENIALPSYLVQHFVNHNAVLYKVFVIGNKHFTTKRPSIRDLDLSAEHDARQSITFDSALVSKATSASPLNIEGAVSAVTAVPNEGLLCSLLDEMRARFGLSLFGVDVVIENGSEDLYVVDVNYFPGYNGGAGWQFQREFASFLRSRLETPTPPVSPQHHHARAHAPGGEIGGAAAAAAAAAPPVQDQGQTHAHAHAHAHVQERKEEHDGAPVVAAMVETVVAAGTAR